MPGLVACGCDPCVLSRGEEQPSGGFLAEPGIKYKAEVPVDEASVTRSQPGIRDQVRTWTSKLYWARLCLS